ncbi:MAG: GNAT family N-acetyltransferase [Clostridium sp.]|nr:GNAT family N-acetyltransferase [Clostridium sp.]
MINLLKDTEIKYVRCYSQEKEYKNTIRFWDDNFKNLYASNLTVLIENLDLDKTVKILIDEIKLNKKSNKRFLNFEVNKEISREELREFNIRPSRVDRFDYMVINTNEKESIPYNNDIEIRKVTSNKEYEDLININIKDNIKSLGYGYARTRILRKVSVYKDEKNKLTAFLIYKNNIPIGSCELFINNNVAKLEDIGILREYRGKGFGSFTLEYMIKMCGLNNIEYFYVITEKLGCAKKVYERIGFKKVGDKTQIIFDF